MKIALPYIAVLISTIESARILGVFPLPEQSHYILGSTLMKGLAEKGHDVTVISPFTEKNRPLVGTYKDVTTTGILEEEEESKLQNEINMFNIHYICPLKRAFFKSQNYYDVIEKTLKHENVQKLINSKESFDVVIVEQFLNDAHKALSTHFRAPLILLSTVGANFWVNPLAGNPAPTSYVPDLVLPYSGHMTFHQRILNNAVYIFNNLLYHFYVFPQQNQLIQKYLPNGPNLHAVLYNASIILLNSHPSTNQPVPHVPNMIQIGGFHIKPPKALPSDLQKFLDGARDGAIYFSMGSTLKSTQFSKEKFEALMNTFSKLKQRILWKWEDEKFPGKLANIMTKQWLPQQDILAHPNIKLFITHGGLLSLIESIYHGVPVLTVPAYGDQFLNARFASDNGYGTSISYDTMTEENLFSEINKLLNDKQYKRNATKFSEILRDQIVHPLDKAIYWVEYVIRHKGAPHLRVAGLELPWYKYHLLDVIGFWILAALSALLLIRIVNGRIRQAGKKVKKL